MWFLSIQNLINDLLMSVHINNHISIKINYIFFNKL